MEPRDSSSSIIHKLCASNLLTVKNVFLSDDATFDFCRDFKLFFQGRTGFQECFSHDIEESFESKAIEADSLNYLESKEGAIFIDQDVELITEMSALGLPTSFGLSSERKAFKQVKNKRRMNKMNQISLSAFRNEELEKYNVTDAGGPELIPTSCDGTQASLEATTTLSCMESVEYTLQAQQGVPLEQENENTECSKVDLIQEPAVFQACGYSNDNSGSQSQGATNLTWAAIWDSHYRRYYFFNRETLESTWEPPIGMEQYAYLYTWEESGDMKETGLEVYGQLHGNNGKMTESSESKEAHCIGDDGKNLPGVLQYQCGPCSHEYIYSQDSLPESSPPQYEDKVQDLLNKGQECEHFDSARLLSQGTEEAMKSDEDVLVFSTKTEICETGQALAFGRRKREQQRKLLAKAGHVPRRVSFPSMEGHLSSNIFKYWVQRYRLFSKFDGGVKLDEEGWFSVTPEVIAKHQAASCGLGVIIDAFAGVGGNAIQFAQMGSHVIAIDIDPRRVEYAHHNANIYGVADLIDFIVGDFFQLSSSLKADVVFLSPPWGGPEYMNVESYDIQTMLQPKDGATLLKIAQQIAPKVAFFLPRNVGIDQLAELSLQSDRPVVCEVEKIFVNDRFKAITAYYGDFTRQD